jgi:signal transduction histidine kinase
VEPRAVQYAPPPLTRWQSALRYLGAVALSAVVWGTVLYHTWEDPEPLFWVDFALGPLSFFLLRWRRRWPLEITLAIVAISSISPLSAGPAVLALLSLSTTRRWRWILPSAVLFVVAAAVYFWLIEPDQDIGLGGSLVFTTIATGAVVAIGMYVGARRDLLAALRERADRAEREQTWRVGQAKAAERARIAREMHDVLAHRLSLVAMHAGALSYRHGLSEQEVADAADIIQSSAHQALGDLREVLGVLREEEMDVLDRPQPTLKDVPALLEEARVAGTHVRLHNFIGDLSVAPDAIGRSAYRVIQESLTNARKHAPDTTVDISLSGTAGQSLALEVRNPTRVGAGRPQTPGAGLGLIGLAERAELSGGSLEHAFTDEGDFVVRSWFPWPA